MAIYRLLKTLPMGPEEIAVLAEAYEHTLRKLNLVERSDPVTQLIAKKIIEIGWSYPSEKWVTRCYQAR